MKLFRGGAASAILALALASTVLLGFGFASDASPASAATPMNLVTTPSQPTDLAFDSAGNMYIADSFSETVQVMPKVTGSLFGVPVTANKLTTIATLGHTDATTKPDALFITLDGAGNLYVASADTDTLSVLPVASGTLFGVGVTANTLTTLETLPNPPTDLAFNDGNLYISEYPGSGGLIQILPQTSGTIFGVSVTADSLANLPTGTATNGLAFDSSGNLYLTGSGISVIAKSAGTIFGVAVAANTVATLAPPPAEYAVSYGLAFDAQGNLYAATDVGGEDENAVYVLPQSSGTLFGQTVTADTMTQIAAGPQPIGVGFDAQGNLYFTNDSANTVSVLPVTSGSLFGVPVTADSVATVASGLNEPSGIARDAAGDLFVADAGDNAVYVLPKATGTMFGVPVTAGILTPLVTSGVTSPQAVAVDASGNLFIGGSPGAVSVLSNTSGTVFGNPVSADTLSTVVPDAGYVQALAFGTSGNLFISTSDGTIQVLSKTSEKVFGVPVTLDNLTTIASVPGGANGLAFDGSGNLYFTSGDSFMNNGLLQVLPESSGTIFGVPVTANTIATLSSTLIGPTGLAFDAGDLFIANVYSATNMLQVLPASTGTAYGVPVTANTLTTVESGSWGLVGLTADAAGDLYLSNAVGSIAMFAGPPSPQPTPTTSVLLPSKGAALSGTAATLDASASNATSVEFLLFGGSYGYDAPVICTATLTYYGWYCSWNTTTVPDGSYVLVSEASGAGGSTYSSGAGITVRNPLPTTSVLVPSNGATLSGSTALDASASNATSVEFLLFGGSYGYDAPVICTATLTYYGWVCSWNTTTVPDGSYVLVSEASNTVGSTYSSGASVTVNN